MSALSHVGLAEADAFERPAAAPEFTLSDADFRELVRLAREQTGIALSDSKRNLIYGRLSRRLRALRLPSFTAYREYLGSADGEGEIEHFINAISTNLTSLFREAHHFDHFREHVALPFAKACENTRGQRLRVWSAGCSTGEEPYSIALVLNQALSGRAGHDARILATDIDTDVLNRASRGEYPLDVLKEIPAPYRETVKAGASNATGRLAVKEQVRSLITFKRLNLMDAWPMQGQFDAVFCRNVMIYFDAATKLALVERLTAQIKPGGWLYIGHSESLLGSHPNLQLMGRTVYRRIG